MSEAIPCCCRTCRCAALGRRRAVARAGRGRTDPPVPKFCRWTPQPGAFLIRRQRRALHFRLSTNSAMDGYAIPPLRSAGNPAPGNFRFVDRIAVRPARPAPLPPPPPHCPPPSRDVPEPGVAARIFTGAPGPLGCRPPIVMKQEHSYQRSGTILLEAPPDKRLEHCPAGRARTWHSASPVLEGSAIPDCAPHGPAGGPRALAEVAVRSRPVCAWQSCPPVTNWSKRGGSARAQVKSYYTNRRLMLRAMLADTVDRTHPISASCTTSRGWAIRQCDPGRRAKPRRDPVIGVAVSAGE